MDLGVMGGEYWAPAPQKSVIGENLISFVLGSAFLKINI
jgi:hypothetical protein